MNTVFVKPAKGRNVRDPKDGQHIPATGKDVPRTRYWIARLADGDVVEATPAASRRKASGSSSSSTQES